MYIIKFSNKTEVSVGYKHAMTAPALKGKVRDCRCDIRTLAMALYDLFNIGSVLIQNYPTDTDEISNKLKSEESYADGINDICKYRPEFDGRSKSLAVKRVLLFQMISHSIHWFSFHSL